MYIKSLSIDGMRCFEKAKISFQYPGLENGSTYYPNINVLVGDNGSGKSTALQAIALACLAPTIDASGYVPYFVVRQGMDKAKISARFVLHPQDTMGLAISDEIKNPTTTTQIIRQGKNEIIKRGVGKPTTISQLANDSETEESPAFMVLGYGATRRVEPGDYILSSVRKSRRLRYQRLASLFEDYVTQVPIAWMSKLFKEHSGRTDEITKIFRQLLPDDVTRKPVLKNDELMFSQGNIDVPYAALSDGYRSFIGWVSDMLYYLSEVCPPNEKLQSLKGIVLIDEIDLHLHPSWQSVVLEKVSKTFPKMQFIVTTHSAIVAGTLDNQSLFLMQPQAPDAPSDIVEFKTQIFGLNADQVLRSEYFGLESSRAPGFRNELRDVEQRALSGDQNAALEFMTKLTKGGNP